MVGLAVVGITVVVVLEEEVLIGTVSSEGDGGDTESREKTLEAVPAAEGTGIAPGLTVQWLVLDAEPGVVVMGKVVLASPGVALGPNGVGMGRSLELRDIEAGDVPRRHCG